MRQIRIARRSRYGASACFFKQIIITNSRDFFNNSVKSTFSARHERRELQHSQLEWGEDRLAHELHMQRKSVPGE